MLIAESHFLIRLAAVECDDRHPERANHAVADMQNLGWLYGEPCFLGDLSSEGIDERLPVADLASRQLPEAGIG